jgi:hypothetical protein
MPSRKGSSVKPTVFVQANAPQMLGARISAYSFKRNSRTPDEFDVRILDAKDFPRLMATGETFLRDGFVRAWEPDDLQSFTPLRFAPPSLMGFESRAVVVDPDCFAVGDVAELFAWDMAGKAICAVWQRPNTGKEPRWASSVMLLDCAKLRHWDFDRLLRDLFADRFDYLPWNRLELEDQATIGKLEPEWNSFDVLASDTRILHTTRRRTQPWKTGLPVDYTLHEAKRFRFARAIRRPRYARHPDRNVEAFIYALLAEMVDAGLVSKGELEAEMAANHIRHDSLRLIDRYRGWEPARQAA